MPPERPDERRKVLSASFRMAVEKQITKFLASSDEVIDFPSTLNRDQRNFASELAYKFGLKATFPGKGLERYVSFTKTPGNLHPIPTANLDLLDSSKKVALKMLELTSNATEDEHFPLQDSSFEPLGQGLRTSHSRITIPPKPVNSRPSVTQARQKLPIFGHRNEILNLIKNNQIVVIESTTGSGKSTQIPQYILEDCAERQEPCRIIVAEPRRICATSLADRVSFERGETVGGTVGYQIRLESKVAPNSNLIYVTNGIILRMLMNGKPEEFFANITALVIDEVHERDKFSDFLLICVREFLERNSNVRVIIMSATVDSGLFACYFDGCPVIKIEGRQYPVKEKFLEDILRDLNFSNSKVRELEQKITDDPEYLNRRSSNDSFENKNMDDDTKDLVLGLLEAISGSAECEKQFSSFAYFVRVVNVPVDLRHEKTGKTALMFAVEYGLIPQVEKLLNLRANPHLTAKINGEEQNAFNIAAAQRNEALFAIMMKHMELRCNGSNIAANGGVEETSLFDRKILDIYYDTLILPGVNRGQFLDDVVDLNLIVRIIVRLHYTKNSENAILVFLPGHDEIIKLANLLLNALDNNVRFFILHSQMMTSDQRNVFDEMRPGVRKIIIATNIAESSITVNDVVYVIDSGKEKSSEFNAINHVSSLPVQWISKASAKQRMGRTGRCGSGMVFRMYSRDRYNSLVDNQQPEFLRSDLTDVCLQTKMIARPGVSVEGFLQKALTPPNRRAVQESVRILQQIGALRPDQTITRLGLYLADIPINAKYGKMLIYGILFKCLDPVLTIVSILCIGDPFTLPCRLEQREACHKIKLNYEANTYSDHFILLRVFQKWNEYITTNDFDGGFCEDNFINSGTMERILSTRTKIVGYMRSVKLIQSVGNLAVLNEYASNWSIVKACLAAGAYPDIAFVMKEPIAEFRTQIDPKVTLNPGSVLRRKYCEKIDKKEISALPGDWMIFEEKNLCGKFGMTKTCSLTSSICIAMTAGHGIIVTSQISEDENQNLEQGESENVDVEIDDFIKFTAPSVVGHLVKDLREKLNKLLCRFLMNVEKFQFKESDEIFIQALVKLFEFEEEKAGFNINHEGVGSRPRIITRDSNSSQRSLKYESVRTKASKTEMIHRSHQQNEHNIKKPTLSEIVKPEPPTDKQNLAQEKCDSLELIPKKETSDIQESNEKASGNDQIASKHSPTPDSIPSMRIFMIELKSLDILQADNKENLNLFKDGKLPRSTMQTLIEIEINDPINKKTFLFHFNKKLVGAAILMSQDNCDIQVLFFSQSSMDFSELSCLDTQTIDKLATKEVVEIDGDVGSQIVYLYVKDQP